MRPDRPGAGASSNDTGAQSAGLRASLRAALDRRFPGAAVTPMVGDASSRRYYRVTPRAGPSRVVMDYGKPFEGETEDLRLERLFRGAGLPVARVVDALPDPGCLLLEDLGQWTLEATLSRQGTTARDVERWYRRATDLAAAVATRGTRALDESEMVPGGALDAERFRFEMDFFLEHYAGALRRTGYPDALRERLYRLAEDASATPRRVLCHRDFHSRNLMVLENRSLAMVDIQDARPGPDTYDLASLLRDAYAEPEEPLVESSIERYRRTVCPDDSPVDFRRRFDTVAAQRMIKALGTFGYQTAVSGRASFLVAAERTIRRLRRLLPLQKEQADLHAFLHEAGLLDSL